MIEFEVTLAQLQPPGTLEMDKIGVFYHSIKITDNSIKFKRGSYTYRVIRPKSFDFEWLQMFVISCFRPLA